MKIASGNYFLPVLCPFKYFVISTIYFRTWPFASIPKESFYTMREFYYQRPHFQEFESMCGGQLCLLRYAEKACLFECNTFWSIDTKNLFANEKLTNNRHSNRAQVLSQTNPQAIRWWHRQTVGCTKYKNPPQLLRSSFFGHTDHFSAIHLKFKSWIVYWNEIAHSMTKRLWDFRLFAIVYTIHFI